MTPEMCLSYNRLPAEQVGLQQTAQQDSYVLLGYQIASLLSWSRQETQQGLGQQIFSSFWHRLPRHSCGEHRPMLNSGSYIPVGTQGKWHGLWWVSLQGIHLDSHSWDRSQSHRDPQTRTAWHMSNTLQTLLLDYQLLQLYNLYLKKHKNSVWGFPDKMPKTINSNECNYLGLYFRILIWTCNTRSSL